MEGVEDLLETEDGLPYVNRETCGVLVDLILGYESVEGVVGHLGHCWDDEVCSSDESFKVSSSAGHRVKG